MRWGMGICLLVGCGAGIGGCVGGSDSEAPVCDTPPVLDSPPAGKIDSTTPCMNANGCLADGVWVFWNDPADYCMYTMGRVCGGEATIVDGCLYVGGAVVAWDPDHLDDAQTLISAVRAGAHPMPCFGGGISSVPAVIAERCPTEYVWLGGPCPLDFAGPDDL
jgi:hypothetical protein